MRDRHLPRLCGTCAVPMARQEDRCWSCGAPAAPASSAAPLRLTTAAAAERFDDDGGHPARPARPVPAQAGAAV